MKTRPRFLLPVLLVLFVLALAVSILFAFQQLFPSPKHTLTPPKTPSPATLSSPVDYVNPFIGTDGGGNVFPGASYPHGMVQWSPDTTNGPGGYRYSQSLIHGFSLTHFSGRGCSAYQDIPFFPTLGSLSTSPLSTNQAHFSHDHEIATAGYYSVRLDETQIQVALTVTPRTGFAQFTYPSSHDALLLINAAGSATGNAEQGTGVQIVGNDEVSGSATSGHFCGSKNLYTLYFVARFDHPFSSFGTWHGSAFSADTRSSNGRQSEAYLRFDATQQQLVQVKVGISFVSTANAALNLEQENPGWNFAQVQRDARVAWNTRLSTIQVSGGSSEQKQVFYTALYHTLFHPNIFSDVNGDYLGFDQRVHVAQHYTQYENFPGWDMYRSLIALLSLLEPKETGDMLQSLVMDAQQGGGGLPRWEVANDNSGGMVGDSDDVLFATSYAFGVRGFDSHAALRAMDAGASQPTTYAGKYPTREGLDEYLNNGYVSTHLVGSAAITLEYATDDFALAQFAKALGNTALYTTYMQRSHNWQHLFRNGYIEPRNADGSFMSGYTPESQQGFVESDGSIYSWMVPYDLPTLFRFMGGNAQVVQRLDAHFTELNAGPTSPYAFMGNEPEFAVPWEYDFAGAPYRTQDVIHRIETQLFKPTPDGLPGNDDGGAMSSWYVFAALGFYPEIPGVASFALGSPQFPDMIVHLGNGQVLHITAPNVTTDSYYVQQLLINGKAYTSSQLPFSLIEHGATLEYSMSSRP